MLLNKIKHSYKATIGASCIAYITQAIAVNFPPLLFLTLQKTYSLSLSQISSLIIATFFIQLTVDIVSAGFVDKIGYRICIIAAHIMAALGFIMLGILPDAFANPFIGILISCFFYAFGSGLIEVLVSPLVEACPTDNKTAAMGLLHSFFSWGTAIVILLSTVFFFAYGTSNWRIITVLWSIVPIANTFMFLLVPICRIEENQQTTSIKALLTRKIFWVMLVLMLCAGASELAMSQWASAFAESGLGVSKSVGDLAGPFMFAVLMGIGRVIYARFIDKKNLIKYMGFCAVLCIISYITAAVAPNPVVSLIGCAVTGFSVGVFWPGSYSFAAEKCPDGGTALFALLAFAGDIGCTIGPSVVGYVSDSFGGNLNIGLLVGTVFPLILLFTLFLTKDKR